MGSEILRFAQDDRADRADGEERARAYEPCLSYQQMHLMRNIARMATEVKQLLQLTSTEPRFFPQLLLHLLLSPLREQPVMASRRGL